jgi:SpoVK/Ycf46/Vps4 family AAA+-type ATPase
MTVSGKIPKPPTPVYKQKSFLIDLLSADIDIDLFLKQIEANKDRRFSLCLNGPPGSGKTELVNHISEVINMPILRKKGSDIQSMFKGLTEQKIAEAFKKATLRKMFLVFEEADSLLQDRRGAVRSWEISEVNEMLSWMESHPLPVACTTNLPEKLDRASLRRFTFKIKLGFLTEKKAALAFKHFFGVDREIPLSHLTIADFALTAEKASFLGISEHDKIYDLLKSEADSKEENSGKIGF